MKKISITESEKENILNIHIKYGYNNLSEQSVNQNFKEFFDKWPCLNAQGYTDKQIQTKDNNKYFTFKNKGNFAFDLNVVYAIKLSDGKMYKINEDGDYETTNTIAKCPD
jgi:hypothetical protein